ncbi:MAG: hypothetical protein FJX75_25530 [Armatimonadetes bacterium]|nr:hypothetical protein [Armatimonadota bacterium]
MAEQALARLCGRVQALEDGRALGPDGLAVRLVRARDGEVVVSGVPVGAGGEYELGAIEAGELYLVYINDILGIPAAVIPEEGDNEQAFHWSAVSSISPITGEVFAYDGVTHLAVPQRFGLRDVQLGEWAWPSSPTKDMGGWQALPLGCAVPSGRTYEIVINYGPGFEGDPPDNSELYVPPPGVDAKFRRNSGTVCVGLIGASGGERMRFVGRGGSYLVRVVPYPGCTLVSLPCNEAYTVYAWPTPPPAPPPQSAQCPPPPEQPWVMPCRSGGGSDRVDFQMPW